MQLADVAGADPVSGVPVAVGRRRVRRRRWPSRSQNRRRSRCSHNPSARASRWRSRPAATPGPGGRPVRGAVHRGPRTLHVSRAEREAFIAALHAVATGPAGPQKLPPALVVAAVRADFLGRLIAYPPLKAALDAGLFTVGPMSEAELRLAMTGPAAKAGLAVESALVEAVIAELREGAECWSGQWGAATDVAGDGRHLGTSARAAS